jgi:hypothetical protein
MYKIIIKYPGKEIFIDAKSTLDEARKAVKYIRKNGNAKINRLSSEKKSQMSIYIEGMTGKVSYGHLKL